jgi:chemotaxis protein MotB
MSYSDLMAGLVLILMVALVSYFAAHKRAMQEERTKLEEQKQKQTAQARQLEEQKGKFRQLQLEIGDVLGVRTQLMHRIKQRFEEKGRRIYFDDATGAVRLPSDIFFAEGYAILTSRGKRELDEFMPTYCTALLGSSSLRNNVDRITFEGHTNSNCPPGKNEPVACWLENLKLSQMRARAAVNYILESGLCSEYDLEQRLVSSGFSSSRPIYRSEQEAIEDKEASRRIEIKFRLKDEKALRRLKQMLEDETLELKSN